MSKLKFFRYIGIDYSGGKTPTDNLPGLQVYIAKGGRKPEQQPPSKKSFPSRKNWSRKDIAEWLLKILSEETPTLVGIDHAFSFPLKYFDDYAHKGLKRTWPAFLKDFQNHWPTCNDDISVDSIFKGEAGKGEERWGFPGWLRLTEERAGGAKSVFHLGNGTVTYATFGGIPWLRYMRQKLRQRVHFWPFDGWDIPNGCSAIVEVYPALYKEFAPKNLDNNHQRDAYSVAAWMSESDRNGKLAKFLKPNLETHERKQAQIEGWILGTCKRIHDG